jgi:universal stress protein A
MKSNIVELPFTEEGEHSASLQSAVEARVPLKLQQILVPTDFSECSQKAVEYALAFARQFGASLTLLHVLEPVPYPAGSDYMLGEVQNLHAKIEDEAHVRLMDLVRTGIEPDISAAPMIRIGIAWQEITEVARERDIDLIIIGTHGYTGLKHLVLGSTAEKVVRHAPCPVLTVREREHEFVDA